MNAETMKDPCKHTQLTNIDLFALDVFADFFSAKYNFAQR